MRVHLARLDGPSHINDPADAFAALAAADAAGVHQLTPNPDDADLILFTQCHLLPHDWRLTAIRRHPLTLAHPEKAMVYDERDRPWCALPGVYVSMPQRWLDPSTQRAWGYYTVPEVAATAEEPDLLFSLIASNTASCRPPLLALRHPEAIVEQPDQFTFFDSTTPKFEAHRARFKSVLARSRFVLCPRGRGVSSIRMYETMAAGRVPVVIADDWAPPAGPDWDRCIVRWPEHRTEGLIRHLEAAIARWPSMSAAALATHETFFARSVAFHHVVERCAEVRPPPDLTEVRRPSFGDRAYVRAGLDATRWRVEGEARRRVRSLIGPR